MSSWINLIAFLDSFYFHFPWNCLVAFSATCISTIQNIVVFTDTVICLDILLTVRLSIVYFIFISNSIHYSLPSTYSICCPLSSTCFRPHRPIIRRSKLYMQPVVLSPSADVFVVWPLRENFLNGHTTKTSAEGESTTGCMYNIDLVMMGLWGLKHVEERG